MKKLLLLFITAPLYAALPSPNGLPLLAPPVLPLGIQEEIDLQHAHQLARAVLRQRQDAELRRIQEERQALARQREQLRNELLADQPHMQALAQEVGGDFPDLMNDFFRLVRMF